MSLIVARSRLFIPLCAPLVIHPPARAELRPRRVIIIGGSLISQSAPTVRLAMPFPRLDLSSTLLSPDSSSHFRSSKV